MSIRKKIELKIFFVSKNHDNNKYIPFFLGESSWFVAAAKAREAMAIKVIKQWKDFSMFPYYQLTTDSSSSSLYHQRSISISLRFVRASSNQISGRVNSYWCPKSNALLTFLDPKAAFFKVSIIYLEYFFHFSQQKIS